MNKLRKIISNTRRRLMTMAGQAWDVILAFVLLCMAKCEGEDAPEEYEGGFTPKKKTR